MRNALFLLSTLLYNSFISIFPHLKGLFLNGCHVHRDSKISILDCGCFYHLFVDFNTLKKGRNSIKYLSSDVYNILVGYTISECFNVKSSLICNADLATVSCTGVNKKVPVCLSP